jgi:hypothetical protein
VTTGVPQAVRSQAYFQTESNLIKTLLEEQSAFIDAGSITALSFFNGEYVDFSTSQSYLSPSSPRYGSVAATRYRTVAGSLTNSDKSASLILIETIVDPDAEGIVPFILRVRSTLKRSSIVGFAPSVPLAAYLNGGYCSTYDVQVKSLYWLCLAKLCRTDRSAMHSIPIRSCCCTSSVFLS